jgi:hypothetical protein
MAVPDDAFLDSQQTALDNAARRRSDIRDAAGLGFSNTPSNPWSTGDVNDRSQRDLAVRPAWDFAGGLPTRMDRRRPITDHQGSPQEPLFMPPQR